MKTYIFYFSIFLSFNVVHSNPEAISQVEFSIRSENGMNPYGAKKYTEYSSSGVKNDKMKIEYTVSHPSSLNSGLSVPVPRIPKDNSKYQQKFSQTYNNVPPMTYQSYPFYEPPKVSKNQYQPPSYETINFNQFPAYKPQFPNSHRPKRINLPKKVNAFSSAALLPNASPYAKQENFDLGVNLGEALDKTVPLIYY